MRSRCGSATVIGERHPPTKPLVGVRSALTLGRRRGVTTVYRLTAVRQERETESQETYRLGSEQPASAPYGTAQWQPTLDAPQDLERPLLV